jgi:branched-chain amino acid transport system substrate-binding protein
VIAAGAAAVVAVLIAAAFLVVRPLIGGTEGGSTAGAGGPGAATSPVSSGAQPVAGGGSQPLTIASDLPLQGAAKDTSDATNNAIALYLSQIGSKVGNHPITFKKYDDATAAAKTWDATQCQKNASAHNADAAEVAVVGPYNSGCAKVEVPILNQAPNGPLVMVSHGNTNPGLTKSWQSGEPGVYYPTGKRNYARVLTTDDAQGDAVATFAKTQGVTRVYVLNDNESYGQGVALAFAAGAKAAGITVLGDDVWDAKATSYAPLFQKIKAAGADAVFFGGIYDSNGARLVKDKVTVLGDNAKVKMLTPDGFTGYPEFNAMPEAQGVYMCFPGLPTDRLQARGGAVATFLAAYQAKYGTQPYSSYALYGVAAMQAVIEAIKASDGTRKGVRDAMFSGKGVTVSATTSVLGRAFSINPSTGDVTLKDFTIETVKGNQETFLTELSL